MTFKLAWERVVLPNGARLLLFNRPSDASVRLCVGVEYGSNADPPCDAGLAHLVEHMLNSGSRKRAKMIEEMDRLGASYDCSVNREYTYAALQVPPNNIAEASEILHQIVFSPVFERRKLDLQKQVVLQEIDGYSDDPERKADDLLMKTLFSTHPAGRPISGFRKSVEAFSLAKVKSVHQTHYVPCNSILAIVGNYRSKDAETFSRRFSASALSDTSTAKAPTRQNSFGKLPFHEVVRRRRGLNRAYVAMGAITVPITSSDSVPLSLACSILGGGCTSRLFKELREKRGLAYDVSSEMEQGPDYGCMVASASVKPRNLPVALGIIRREFAKLGERQNVASELRKIKRGILGGTMNAIDDPFEFPETIVAQEIFYRDVNSLANRIEEISKTAVDDVTEAADRYLNEENLATVVLKP